MKNLTDILGEITSKTITLSDKLDNQFPLEADDFGGEVLPVGNSVWLWTCAERFAPYSQMGHGNIQVTQRYYIATSRTGIDVLQSNIDKL